MKILALAAICAAALALSGCPIVEGTKYTVGGTRDGVERNSVYTATQWQRCLELYRQRQRFVFRHAARQQRGIIMTVRAPPSNPSQTCTVRNGSGTIDKAGITNVIVSCTQTGRFAYIANRQSNSISDSGIDPATGRLVLPSGSPFAWNGTTPTALAVDPNGRFLYVGELAAQ